MHSSLSRWGCALAALLLFLAQSALATEEPNVEKYPDGKKKAVFTVASDGTKQGAYEEFYPNGKHKIVANYAAGQLQGPYVEHYESGKFHIKANYQKGQLHGKYQEFAEDGSLLRAAGYREGKLHGPNQVFDKKQTVKDEFWVDGKLLLPKSAAQMKAEFAAIDKRAVESVGDFPAQEGPWKPRLSDPAAQRDREAALRILQAYRYLCDLPYRDLVLDREEIAHAEAASDLLVKLGRLEHTPANPGWPDDQYKFAYRGTSSSNLHQGGKAMAPTVHGYMADADENNMKTLGHRRWCLNPAMGKTGFGQAGDFGAMWSFDSSRRDVRDYDQVAFPPIGLTPTVCFKDNYPWSLTLNPKKFAQPKESEIKVKVFPARLSPKTGDVEKLGAALELNYFHVNNDGYGVNNCIIFRPTGVQAVANSAYWVEVTGIKTKKNVDAPLEYFVGFFSLNP